MGILRSDREFLQDLNLEDPIISPSLDGAMVVITSDSFRNDRFDSAYEKQNFESSVISRIAEAYPHMRGKIALRPASGVDSKFRSKHYVPSYYLGGCV